ncbi:MAG: SDR family NAD(P)-dependent oxidoreductase, partial [Gaiellaceae bacterium]
MSRLDGKVALVSGGSRGIGEAIARALVAEGAKVVIGDVLDAEGTVLSDELGPDSAYVHLDVTSRAYWAAADDLATATFRKLDV